MDKYGKTKLDHGLSYFAIAFEKILEFLSILFVPVLTVQQIVAYGVNHPARVITVLAALMIVLVVLGAHMITKKKNSGEKMKLRNKFLNSLFLVDKPITLATSNKIALLIVVVCMLLLGALQNFQPVLKVF